MPLDHAGHGDELRHLGRVYFNKTIESFGTGFGSVFNACEHADVKCDYGNGEFRFYFDFMRPKISGSALSQPWSADAKLSDTEKQVLAIISSTPNVIKREIAVQIAKTEMTVHRAIQHLTELKLVERVGSKKTGHWQIARPSSRLGALAERAIVQSSAHCGSMPHATNIPR